jgi:hypothetical protein
LKTQVHPGVFLASAVAVSAAWLWLRPAAQTAAPAVPTSRAAAPRPADTRPSVQVDASVLRRYAGRYALDGFAVAVRVDGRRLLVRADDFPPLALRAASETKFFFEDFLGEITFEAGDPAKGFVADLADGRHRATRVGD